MMKIPIIVHESDVVMGLANRKISGFAEKVCVSFPTKNYEHLVEANKLIETGNPIRDDVMMGDGDNFKKDLGFKKDKKTLLVLGGSQGSRFINDLIIDKIEKILREWQLIWVTGDRDIDLISYQVENIDKELRQNLRLYGFLTTEMADVYAASDLVISRAGSNVLFELAALRKPVILIPYDESAGSHQLENAKLFSRSGAAYLFRQDNLNSDKLFHQIDYLFSNPDELDSMRAAMTKWSDLGSSEKVANEIINVGEREYEENRKTKE